MAAEEIIQIVDRQNKPVTSKPRHIMREQGLIHRASYILVFNSKEELFIQKRTMSKDIYPGYWDVAAGGVVLANESYEVSATRELEEELGITEVTLTPLFDHYYEDRNNKVWGRIFKCKNEGPFILQEEEISFGRFISIKEALLLSAQEPFTPDGLEIILKL